MARIVDPPEFIDIEVSAEENSSGLKTGWDPKMIRLSTNGEYLYLPNFGTTPRGYKVRVKVSEMFHALNLIP